MSQNPRPNPYQSPSPAAARHEFPGRREAAIRAVKGPAIALISVGSLSIAWWVFCVVWDLVVLATDSLAASDPAFAPFQMTVKTLWGIVIACNCGFSIWAGWQMRKLWHYQACFLASILASIPGLSPCLCVGIPFGIWAIISLSRSEVKQAFD